MNEFDIHRINFIMDYVNNRVRQDTERNENLNELVAEAIDAFRLIEKEVRDGSTI